MARTSELTFDAVAQACTELFGAGEATSFQKVYEKLGRKGSAAIVQRYISEWRQSVADQLNTERTSPDLPPELISTADTLVAALWKQALDHADRAYQERYTELEEARAVWAARVNAAEEKVDGLAREKLMLQGDLKALGTQLDARNEAVADLQSRLATANSLLAEKDTQIVALREDSTRISATLDAERRQHTADLAAERQRHDEQLAAERARFDTEVSRLREHHEQETARAAEIAQGERAFLMQQTDQIRQAAQQNETHLKEQLATQKQFAEGFKKQAYQSRDEAAAARGRADLLEEQLAQLRKELKSVRLLDVVATLSDIPDISISAGQIGTIVEELDPENALVEFADESGQAIAVVPVPIHSLIRLNHGEGRPA